MKDCNSKKSNSWSFEAVQWIRCSDPVLQNHSKLIMTFSKVPGKLSIAQNAYREQTGN